MKTTKTLWPDLIDFDGLANPKKYNSLKVGTMFAHRHPKISYVGIVTKIEKHLFWYQVVITKDEKKAPLGNVYCHTPFGLY